MSPEIRSSELRLRKSGPGTAGIHAQRDKMICENFAQRNRSLGELAKEFNLSRERISHILRKAGVRQRDRSGRDALGRYASG